MRIYVDTSALIKRAVAEDHSEALIARLAAAVEAGDQLGASSLAWVEVERALRFLRSLGAHGDADLFGAVQAALSGIDEIAVTDQVLRTARWIGADHLRSLDALHLATAALDGTDLIITYDERLAAAAQGAGIAVESPGSVGTRGDQPTTPASSSKAEEPDRGPPASPKGPESRP